MTVTSNFVSGDCLKFTYENYRGEVADRTVIFRGVLFGKTKYHITETILIEGFCADRKAYRLFDASRISGLSIVCQ